MKELALVVRPASGMTHDRFAAAVTAWSGGCATVRQRCIADHRPPRLSVMPLAHRPAALLLAEELLPATDELVVHAYRVETTEPLAGPNAGAGMVTLFSRRPGLDTPTFMRRWHQGHSPLAMSVHPLVRYVRHRVVEALDGAPALDGIVLEMTATRGDLTSPWTFFGGPLRALPNMVRIGLDARGFIDLSTIENQLVTVR